MTTMVRSRAVRLEPRRVDKPWGRRDLGPWFADAPADAPPVGEIWFEEDGGGRALLVKLLFTAARLSVQVHPDDDTADAAGLPRGKDEAWVVVGAQPPAEIAIGLRAPADAATLRAAALDGSIVDRLDWAKVAPDDALYSPAGTIHAIGAGLVILEVQQNVDVTYRLFDYGSDRPLDLDAGLAAARPTSAYRTRRPLAEGRVLVASGGKLQIERLTGVRRTFDLDPAAAGGPLWVFAVSGTGRVDNIVMFPGTCALVTASAACAMPAGADWFVAYAGPRPAGTDLIARA